MLEEVSTRVGISGDRKQHVKLMLDVLDALKGSGLVFKGGSSILLCHGGSRFSEDLDFDVDGKRNLSSRINSVSPAYLANGWSWDVKNPKNTSTTIRYVIHVEKGETLLKLKLDISLRKLDSSMKPEVINGIETYTASDIFKQKVNAIVGNEDSPGRTKVRDIYDIDFLLKKPDCQAASEDLKRLKDGLKSPDGILERYIEDWQDDEITSEFQLDELSVDIFDFINARLDAARNNDALVRPGLSDLARAVEMAKSSGIEVGAVELEEAGLSKPSHDSPEKGF